jgi:hypothetical protein
MAISVTCPQCKKSGRLPDHFAGTSFACPTCGEHFTIADPTPSPPFANPKRQVEPAPAASATDRALPEDLDDSRFIEANSGAEWDDSDPWESPDDPVEAVLRPVPSPIAVAESAENRLARASHAASELPNVAEHELQTHANADISSPSAPRPRYLLRFGSVTLNWVVVLGSFLAAALLTAATWRVIGLIEAFYGGNR